MKPLTIVRNVKAIYNVVNVFNFVTPTRSWLHYCLASSVFRLPIPKFYVIDVQAVELVSYLSNCYLHNLHTQ
ncbi:hypothetical protein T11_8069 [Trichinella zimbabwensis]|uniref:Uncharacterized protein n=1 Tax=Trichinella zimbabwensis TaxID=268475 RepID=A0A0V1GXK7_9BILA|nr:hypothetical protein T11_8069 [Trichinella zimbabwensis]